MEMNIICATDENYSPHCGIMLTSMFESNHNSSFNVYIITRGLRPRTISLFQQLQERYNAKINIVTITNEWFKDCPIRKNDHVTIETYFRLIIPRILPIDVERILYLDVDIIVNGNVNPLYSMEIENVALAACTQPVFADGDKAATRLGINKKSYFNAGVLLINVKYWREYHIVERCLELINQKADILEYHDQDTLNIVLQSNRIEIPMAFNFQTEWMNNCNYKLYQPADQKRISDIAHSPVILHYTGRVKPWHRLCNNPYIYFYDYFKRKSLWRSVPKTRNYGSLMGILNFYRKRIEVSLGLRKRDYQIKTLKYFQIVNK